MNENKIDSNLTPISRDEALSTMLVFDERFVDGKNPAHILSFKWNGRQVVSYNGYEIDGDEIITEFPQFYRCGEGSISRFLVEKFKNRPPREALYCKAIVFAAQKHGYDKRKGTDLPYIYHPMEAMQILKDNGCPDNAIVAGVLHDVLEDTKTAPEEILKEFGEDILKIVVSESEDKSKSWKERKQTTIDHLPSSSHETKLVCCADKLSNMRYTSFDNFTIGDKLWERFNASKEDIKWYYQSIVSALSPLSNYDMYKELSNLVKQVFG
jgi:(p)ppGpp synthase/HD superfamily hydrolase